MNKKSPNWISLFLFLASFIILGTFLLTLWIPSGFAGNYRNVINLTPDVNRVNEQDGLLSLLEEALAGVAPERNPFPPGTEIAGLIVEGDQVTIDLRLPQQFLQEEIQVEWVETVNRLVVDLLSPLGYRSFRVRAEDTNADFFPLSDFLPRVIRRPRTVPENDDPFPPQQGGPIGGVPEPPTAGQEQPVGALSGKTVWLSAGHGWMWTGTRWETQRPNVYGVVEDFSNAEAVNTYLANYLWNAGADVWLVRERSLNENEIIVDNDSGAPAYTENGTFSTSLSAGYKGGTYRFAASNNIASASAVWRPDIPESGWYTVYTWYRHGTNRSSDTHYEIHHSGGVTHVSLSQEVHGMTWRYLGEYYFYAGTSGYVTLTNQSSDAGQAVIADAIRFGGGMGSINRGGGISGKPRWEEASRYHAEYMGYPVDSSTNDVIIRPLYAEWELSSGYPQEDGVFVSWHTNCCDKSGSMSFIHSFEPTPGSALLRTKIHNELVQDLRGDWNPDWADRGMLTADFGELRELSTMPGVLLELGYHDTEDPGDADDIKQPKWRQIAARAVYQGIVKYFSSRDATPIRLLPEPPTHLIARSSAPGQVTLSWRPPISGGTVFGDAATGYQVYRSDNGRGFDNGMMTGGNQVFINGLEPGRLYFFRVTALNEGGESFPTPVVAVRLPDAGAAVQLLLVDGFDRLDSEALIPQPEPEPGTPDGTPLRMYLGRMNSYSYAVEHGESLHACGIAFDGALNEAVQDGDISLAGYKALDWFVGEDAGLDDSLNVSERSLIADYLTSGGNLLLSGSNIGWDLARIPGGKDPGFYNQILKSSYSGDDAEIYSFKGLPGGIFEGISGNFDDGTQGSYDVNAADILIPAGDSNLVMEYGAGVGGAGVSYSGKYRLVHFGFPLEALVDKNVRKDLICHSAVFLTGGDHDVKFLNHFPLIFR